MATSMHLTPAQDPQGPHGPETVRLTPGTTGIEDPVFRSDWPHPGPAPELQQL